MIAQIRKLPRNTLDIIKTSSKLADEFCVNAYLVGGFVRDLILEVKNLDLDIVIEGNGLMFSERLASLLDARLVQHRRFGTATIFKKDGLKIDIATARRESYKLSGALPDVEFGTIRDDLARRDFTINAMAIAIHHCEYGSLIDFFNCRQDLKNKKIRILHDLSFQDDPTRILRAIRFKQRLGFDFEKNTRSLIERGVKENLLDRVHKHRLRDELILLLKEASPISHIKELQKTSGLGFIYPGLKLNARRLKLLKRIEKTISWFNNSNARKRSLDSWLMYLMVMLDGLKYRDIIKISSDFAFGKGITNRLLSYNKFTYNAAKKLYTICDPHGLHRALEHLSYEVILVSMAKFDNITYKKNIINFLENVNGVKIFINGGDLKKLGITPSPQYKNILSRLLQAKLRNRFSSKEEELGFLKKLLKK